MPPSKIPPHAKCVFKGIIFDVYQWKQEMFDGSLATFEMLKRPATVQVIALQGDKVLYGVQEQPGKPPFLSLFGGRSEEGEDPLVAAKRELREETGMESNDWRELFIWTAPGKIDWTIHYFVARNCVKTGEQTLDAGEKIDIHTATVDTFVEKIITDPAFIETELRQKVLSALNTQVANELKRSITGE